MKRIALVFRNCHSNWVSCQSITRNLKKSYSLAFPECEIGSFHVDDLMPLYETNQEASRLFQFRPDIVAFIDHAPHPELFLKCVANFYKDQLPKIIIHVFGDFVIKPNEWIAAAEVLKRAEVKFLCASEKQARLIRSLVDGSENVVAWVPFPIDRDEFYFSQERYQILRRRQGLRDDDLIFLYAGRLSLQKNVLSVIRSFSVYLRQINPNSYLWLAGPVDDIGVPYLGRAAPHGLFGYDILKCVKEGFPGVLEDRVKVWGDLDVTELRSLYQASDYFVSFSTHNDEDFGMAPAEAMSCGRPLVLTDWGGYSSFSEVRPESCFMVPVKIHEDRVSPDLVSCLKIMSCASSRRFSLDEQLEISRAAHAFFSCESVGQKIRRCLEDTMRSEFYSFSTLFYRIGYAYLSNSNAPFRCGTTYSKLYREVYESYI